MGSFSPGETMSFIKFWNKDLMNEGQGMPDYAHMSNLYDLNAT